MWFLHKLSVLSCVFLSELVASDLVTMMLNHDVATSCVDVHRCQRITVLSPRSNVLKCYRRCISCARQQ
jgi:hypothetical protein